MVGGICPLNNLAKVFQISHVQTHEQGGMVWRENHPKITDIFIHPIRSLTSYLSSS